MGGICHLLRVSARRAGSEAGLALQGSFCIHSNVGAQETPGPAVPQAANGDTLGGDISHGFILLVTFSCKFNLLQ